MSTTNNERTFSYELTDDTLDILSEDGILTVAINNITDVTGTVVGDTNFSVDGKSTEPITVAKGTPITISNASPDGRLDKIKITAPSGFTLHILAQR